MLRHDPITPRPAPAPDNAFSGEAIRPRAGYDNPDARHTPADRAALATAKPAPWQMPPALAIGASLDMIEFNGTAGPVAINPNSVDAVIHVNPGPPNANKGAALGQTDETDIIIGGRAIRVTNPYSEVLDMLLGQDDPEAPVDEGVEYAGGTYRKE